MKPEILFWRWLKSKLSRVSGFRFERIENSAGRSTPDIAYSWGTDNTAHRSSLGLLESIAVKRAPYWGGHGWIELKCQKAPKIRNPGRVIKIPHFTEGQERWLRERGNMGGYCFLFLELGNELLLYDHREVHLKGSCTWSSTKKAFDTKQFLKILTTDYNYERVNRAN